MSAIAGMPEDGVLPVDQPMTSAGSGVRYPRGSAILSRRSDERSDAAEWNVAIKECGNVQRRIYADAIFRPSPQIVCLPEHDHELTRIPENCTVCRKSEGIGQEHLSAMSGQLLKSCRRNLTIIGADKPLPPEAHESLNCSITSDTDSIMVEVLLAATYPLWLHHQMQRLCERFATRKFHHGSNLQFHHANALFCLEFEPDLPGCGGIGNSRGLLPYERD